MISNRIIVAFIKILIFLTFCYCAYRVYVANNVSDFVAGLGVACLFGALLISLIEHKRNVVR